MAAADAVLRHLRRELGTPASDADLLRAYADHRDEDAFRVLVERHGPMILGVCRRRLGEVHAADDAFQTTFLTLARRAGNVRRPDAIATWLFKVALRICNRARAAAIRRRDVEQRKIARPPAEPPAELSARELLNALDDELIRLPKRYRLPLWLVYWQNETHAEAAARLNLSPGALHGRLDRGRKRLANRLRRRGFGPDAAVRALLAVAAGAVAVPGDLLARSVAFAAGPWSTALPTTILTLAAAAMPSKFAPVATLVALLFGAGLIGFTASRERERPDDKTQVAQAPGSHEQPRSDRYGDPLPPGAVQRLGTLQHRNGWPIGDRDRLYLPGGRTLLTFRGAFRWTDVETGREIDYWAPPGSPVIAGVTPDGRLALLADAETIQIWDVTARRQLCAIPDANQLRGSPYALFSPDARHVILADECWQANPRLRCLQVATGRVVWSHDRLAELGTRFSPIDYRSGGRESVVLAQSGALDASVFILNASTGNVIRTFTIPRASCAMSPDGKTLVVACGGIR
jgi:RNA polymerase sigma factor (sigma-70 family)